jgi:hypothetical protein
VNQLCSSCEARPKGIDGHEQIRSHPKAGAAKAAVMIYYCEVCGCMWARQYQGSGIFTWEPLSAAPTGK